jgi:hypothetical protein
MSILEITIIQRSLHNCTEKEGKEALSYIDERALVGQF